MQPRTTAETIPHATHYYASRLLSVGADARAESSPELARAISTKALGVALEHPPSPAALCARLLAFAGVRREGS